MKKIRKGDEVVVLTGKSKGQRGEVVRVKPNATCVVKGVNIVKKHQKPNPQRDIPGGIVEQEAALHVSNVAIWNPETQKADRVGFVFKGERKVRVFKSDSKPVKES